MWGGNFSSIRARIGGIFARVRLALVVAVVTLLTAALFSPSALASTHDGAPVDRPRYDVRVGLSVETRIADLHLVVDLPQSWTTPVLWLYADRLRDPPPSFDEFEAERIYPGGVDSGGYDEVVVVVDGCPAQRIAPDGATQRENRATRGRDVAIAVCARATHPLRLDVQTTLRLPLRYGSLGATRDVMTLGDPWYPLVLPSSSATVPPLADHVVRVAPTDERIVVTASGATLADATHPVVGAEQRAVSHAPVVVLPTGRAVTSDRDAGVQLVMVTDSPEIQARSPFDVDAVPDIEAFDADAAGFVHGTVRDCVSLLRRLGFVAAPADRPHVRGMIDSMAIVEVPARQRLAIPLPGMLLVSDHIFRVLAIDRVRRLHAFPLARHAFSVLMTPHTLASSALEDASWASDLDGALLADRLLLEASTLETPALPDDTGIKKETAKDLVKAFGFHPTVDQLIYAPHVAFGADLFQTIEEPDPDRFGADRARNLDPMGRFVLEKLRDRLGAKFDDAAEQHVEVGVDWRDAAQKVADHDLKYFWKQWIGPHRRVAYRIVDVKSARITGGVRNVVRVERLGETWIREPVVIEVIDDDDHHVRAVWDAAGANGEVSIITPSDFDDARLDPDGRLTQDPTLSKEHPRFDDEVDHSWKPPVFGGFSVSYTATEHRLDFDLSFVVRRRFDLDGGWAIAATNGPRGYGGSVQRVFNFGAMRDLNNRFGTLTLGVGAIRSPQGFGNDPRPVDQASILASIGWETVRQLVDPLTGYGGTVVVAANLARTDGGTTSPNAVVTTRGHAIFWEQRTTASVLIAGGGAIVGNALETQLLGLGGRQILRAFEADQSIGRADAYAIFEQRWHVIDGLYLNAVNASWVRGLELVPWLAAGVSSTPDSALRVTKDGMLAEAGIGLRLLHDWVGIQPAILILDVGFPLARGDSYLRDGAGNAVRERQKFGVWFGFEQIL